MGRSRIHLFAAGLLAAIGAASFAASPAIAQTTILNQAPPAALNTTGLAQILTQSIDVAGGKLYVSTLKAAGNPGLPVGITQTFVPTSAGGAVRYLPLTSARAITGAALTATPGSPTGAVGITRTAGTSYRLTGEATSSDAKTNTVMFEMDLPDSYIAGANIPVIVNTAATGGTITAGSTTMTVTAYSVSVAGIETALTVSAAQQIPTTATPLTFTITGTPLVPGGRIVVQLSMLVTTSAGAGTGVINSVSISG